MDYFPTYYHIYNRGVEKRDVFCDARDYKRFIVSLREFNNHNLGSLRDRLESKSSLGSTQGNSGVEPKEEDKLVEVIAYCLNPNHYHLILKEVEKDGLQKFIHRLATGYTGYFNKKYKRTGSLFQGKHKKAKINLDSRLLYLSAYVNGNHYIHTKKNLENWKYSSMLDYLGKRNGNLCKMKDVLGQFDYKVEDYNKFCKKVCQEIREGREFAEDLLG